MYSAVFCSVVALLICASRRADYNMSVTFRSWATVTLHSRAATSAASAATLLHICPPYLDAWLRAECRHKIMQRVKSQFDVETSLLLRGDVSNPPGLCWLQMIKKKKKHRHVKLNLSRKCLKASLADVNLTKRHLLPYLFPSLHVLRRTPVRTLGQTCYPSGLVVTFGLDVVEKGLKG